MSISMERMFTYNNGQGSNFVTCTNATSPPTSPTIDMRGFSGGTVYIKTGTSITSLAYYVSSHITSKWDHDTPEGATQTTETYYQLTNASGAVTTAVSQSNAYPLPPEVFGVGGLKIVLVGVASEAIEVSLKG